MSFCFGHPPALAQFAQSLKSSVYTAVCHVQAIQVDSNPSELLSERLSSIRLFKATTSGWAAASCAC
jgi:hypothetical protein